MWGLYTHIHILISLEGKQILILAKLSRKVFCLVNVQLRQ